MSGWDKIYKTFINNALKVLAIGIAAILCGLVAARAGGVGSNDDSKGHYDLKFGQDSPFLPSQAKAAFSGFIAPDQFPKASYCAKCHEDVHREWRQSAHANSFRNPFYLKNVNLLIESKGVEFTRHCEGCHNPIALFAGALTKGSPVERSFDEDGVTCMTCHSIEKIQNTGGTGSYVMGVPAVMLKADGTPEPGPVSYDEILKNPKLHGQAVMKDFYRTPEFCAVCHKAAVPKILNEYKWLRAFSVYDEWQQSSWAKQSPLPFYKKDTVSTCQTCHMPVVAAKSDYGAKEGNVKSHRWLGASTTIPLIYGYDEQLERVIAFLKDDLLGIDLFALSKNGNEGDLIAPLDRQRFRLAPGDDVTLGVVIQNKKIGHSLVPEQRDFYESWVEFQIVDAKGKPIAHSGFLKPDGFLDEQAHTYANQLISKEGDLLDLHQVWQTRIRAFDNSILPGRSDLVQYRFRIPDGAVSPLEVTVKVNYRRFRQGFTNFALGENKRLPVIELGSKSTALAIGENAGNEVIGDKEWMRWNNYGIALLDQRQYANSRRAFEKVVALRPDYADGYTNIAIASISYEKYDEAAKALSHALKLSPDDSRALFYQALVFRVQGNIPQAIANFRKVIENYPRLRQARHELGFTYYQQKQYKAAREQFESLQSIDPEDLSAHYNLMLIYRRLGLKEKAAEQAVFFADRKDDPGAGTLALEFLRKHPENSRESVPWHIHVEGMSSRGGSNGNENRREIQTSKQGGGN
jgi:tetratricopeptide (TPR) repeat protein